MSSLRQIHPFPARMAPELALEALRRRRHHTTVLDPMCGSGTVLRYGVEDGWEAIGYDLDPLAVLLSRVGSRRVRKEVAVRASERIVEQASSNRKVHLPWIDDDPETRDFIDFWFAKPQQRQLRLISALLETKRGDTADLLRVALSRTIIKKDGGASLARDVSHSRPHRVKLENDYDVYAGFLAAAKEIGSIVDRQVDGVARVQRRDARRIPSSLDGTIDLVITSPPYLNAIDYMRGHKLSLVWLGHRIADLRTIRSTSVGAEHGSSDDSHVGNSLASRHRKLTPKQQAMLNRYAQDIYDFISQVSKKLSPKGEAIVVVGDSIINGAYVKNSLIVERAATRVNLKLVDKRSRRLPASSRYLPPPRGSEGPLSKRMRSEVVMHFGKVS